MIAPTKGVKTSSKWAFSIVWLGQVVSFLGSGLTSFALGVWVYQTTGSITQYALISLFYTLPGIVFGPLMGALIDRWDRRRAMILSDAGAGLSTFIIVLLLMAGRLELWHIYLAEFVSGTCGALRMPALTAATTQLVPKEQFGRASGLLQIVQVGQFLISPIAAGLLIGLIGLQGVVLVDLITFLFAIFTLFIIHIPKPTTTTEGLAGKGSLMREVVYGWRYIMARPGLIALMALFAITNFTTEMSYVLFTPLFLSFASPAALGTAISLGSLGYLFGSIVMSVWGGSQRRINTVLVSMLFLGLSMGIIGLHASISLITLGIFLTTFCLPIVMSSNQVIWQTKVAPDVQGRVFAIRRTIVLATPPIAYILAGPLADRVFEPMLAINGPLAESVGQIIGVGPGRGSGLLLISMGLVLVFATVIGYLFPRLRRVEDELPDAVTEKTTATESNKTAADLALA